MIPSRVDGEVKVSGILGRAAPIEKKGPAVGDQVIGMGGTTQWKLASLVSQIPSLNDLLPFLQQPDSIQQNSFDYCKLHRKNLKRGGITLAPSFIGVVKLSTQLDL